MNESGHIRPSWNPEALLIKGELTDTKIEPYRKAGFYSAELKAARREVQARKQAERDRANPNFIKRDGRLILQPEMTTFTIFSRNLVPSTDVATSRAFPVEPALETGSGLSCYRLGTRSESRASGPSSNPKPPDTKTHGCAETD
jgi:hypothetical protein